MPWLPQRDVGTCPHLRVQDAPDFVSPGDYDSLAPWDPWANFHSQKLLAFSALSPSWQDSICYWIHLWQSYSWISILYPRNRRWETCFLLFQKRGTIVGTLDTQRYMDIWHLTTFRRYLSFCDFRCVGCRVKFQKIGAGDFDLASRAKLGRKSPKVTWRSEV